MFNFKKLLSVLFFFALFFTSIITIRKVHAATPLDLSVTPVFYDLSSEPGKEVKNKLRFRNNSDSSINLKIEIKKLSTEGESVDVKLEELTSQDTFVDWITLSKNKLKALPKEWIDVPFTVSVPEDAAFGYYWAFYITPDQEVVPEDGTAEYTGAVAIPVLFNVEREGANVDADIVSFKTDSNFYEYLPVKFNTLIANNGNVHIKPVGNIFIKDWKGKEVDTIKFNESAGNILPTSRRSFETTWNNSFITYEDKIENGKAVIDKNGKPVKKLKFNFDKVLNMRIGKYHAKTIFVISDGDRDIPYEAETAFWVFPWKYILGILIFIVLAGIGLANTLKSILKKIFTLFGRFKK